MHERPPLTPPAYLREICDNLREHERELWKWFSAAEGKEKHAQELKLSLLKSTYRLTPADHPALHVQLAAAREALGITVPVTLYQAQSGSMQANAALYYLPDEAHIVLTGPLLSLLNDVETRAVLGHELAHRVLWLADGGDLLIADRILEAANNDARGRAAHGETARRFRLYTEIFADRGALQTAGDLPQTVAALVKISTGLSACNGESYLAQAAEIFAQGQIKSDGITHPEMFLRAHALALWAEGNEKADTALHVLLAGELATHGLDVLDQRRTAELTRRFLAQLLRPTWFRSDAVLAQARLYFPDFVPSDQIDESLRDELLAQGSLLQTYYAYVLLDFIHVDPDLEDMPLAAALQWSEDLGIGAHVEKLLIKELGLKAKEISKIKPKVAEMIGSAPRAHGPTS